MAEGGVVERVIQRSPLEHFLVVKKMEFLDGTQAEVGVFTEIFMKRAGPPFLCAADEKINQSALAPCLWGDRVGGHAGINRRSLAVPEL
jgi:hypothetical protein